MVKQSQSLAEWQVVPAEKAEARRTIYKADPPRFTLQKLPELAGIFKLQTGPQIHARDGIHLTRRDEQFLAFYEQSGAFTFSDVAKLNHASYQPRLPGVEEAASIAREFLAANNLLPENAIQENVQAVNLEQVNLAGRAKQQSTSPNHVCVNYRLQMDGMPTYGPGARIQVCLGDKGEVIGLLHAVRTYQRFAEVELQPRAEVQAILAGKLGHPLEKIELREARLAYYAESFAGPGVFLQPVYVFSLAALIRTRHQKRPVVVNFMTHPIPATKFGPNVSIKAAGKSLRIGQGETLRLEHVVKGGTPPYKVEWSSHIDGVLSDEPSLETRKLSVAHREGKITSHTIDVTVTDANGLHDSYQATVEVQPRQGPGRPPRTVKKPATEIDPFVGVEWCNIYHGSNADISGTSQSAQGFKKGLLATGNWSSRFDWGNDAAREQDFKYATAPGGGQDYLWADNVHFTFFAGHGSPGAFYFGTTIDDHQLAASDAHWGEGLLNWIVIHACNTMMNNFAWTVWCSAFRGLHQMFGFHSLTEGSDPPLGSRFAFWLSWELPIIGTLDMRSAWRQACSECFGSDVEYAMIYANQSGTDTHKDHLPGTGHVSADPTAPNSWTYTKASC